jgi:hypothetical protein
MPRSGRCRIRGNCLDGIALLSLAQAPVAGAAPAAARASAAGGASGAGRAPPAGAAPRAGASRRTGLSPSRRPLAVLGERSKAVSEALRTVARAWASEGRARRQSGPTTSLAATTPRIDGTSRNWFRSLVQSQISVRPVRRKSRKPMPRHRSVCCKLNRMQ